MRDLIRMGVSEECGMSLGIELNSLFGCPIDAQIVNDSQIKNWQLMHLAP
jgi:hypothetical protein